MLGPYGWEQLSTAFLQNGRYLGAGADHHSIGSYTSSDGIVKVKLRLTQHDQTRTVFGSKKKQVDIHIEGKIKKSGKVTAIAHPPGDSKFNIKMRLTRLGELD
jgi:hypothetical protein